MAEKKKKLKSVKRFGARYGRRVKHKLAEVEAVQKGKHICPYCRAPKVKRVAAGIWNCRKCGAKFTGKAYSVKKEIKTEKKEEEPEEESKEEKEE
ncbi:50S ribosomal protein L37ae [Candidatus Woesearchaeota archaeon]|nr:50S ribosomal protein L37ae [Candidatus Woesearchaeota archaeon]